MISLFKIFVRYNKMCFYCEEPTWYPIVEDIRTACDRLGIVYRSPGYKKALRLRRATREHLERRADGGTHDPANIVLACDACNASRGRRTVEQHKAHIRSKQRWRDAA